MATMPWQEIYEWIGFNDPQNPPSLDVLKACVELAEQKIAQGNRIFSGVSKHLLKDLLESGRDAQQGQEKALATKVLAFFSWHAAHSLQNPDEMNFWWDKFYWPNT